MSGTEAMLLFQLGARLFATRAAAVARIAGGAEALAEVRQSSCLGRSWSPARRLVVRGDDGAEVALSVDRVLGLRTVEPGEVRPLPPLAEGWLSTRAVAGLVVLDGAPTPLIDLPTLLRERPEPAPDDARTPHA